MSLFTSKVSYLTRSFGVRRLVETREVQDRDMKTAAAFLNSWGIAMGRAALTAALKGGPFRSKYLESSCIWRQNDLIISKRKVRATYWCKNPTNYANKIGRYLRRKIPEFASLFFPPTSRALSCLMADARAAKCRRHLWAICELKRGENIFCESGGVNLPDKKKHYSPWLFVTKTAQVLTICILAFRPVSYSISTLYNFQQVEFQEGCLEN